MRAVTIPAFGDAGVLRLAECEVPEPGPGEISIDVAFAGVNRAELLLRRGAVDVPLPCVPGIAVSGHVRALGAGVEGLRAGQPVAALTIVGGGGYAEVAVVDARLVAALGQPCSPDRLAAAAVLPGDTSTAILVLQRVARLRAGESVLVHAAAGGVGSQLGQVARLLGARRVIGTVASARRLPAARAFGYDEVVVRERLADRVAALTGGAGFDVIVDPAGGATGRASYDALATGGRLVAMGDASDIVADLSADELWRSGRSVVGFNLAVLAAHQPELAGDALRRAVRALQDGELCIDVRDRIALERAADAHRLIEAGAGARVVLAVGAAR
ncbi:MAG: NADPH:quinone reductase [Solirubrobacteraceae bacterium]|jgi:NADPH2:quinone reductase|nr:NADPH:quinone reductase [Solirubrobacteraceae bacterium]